MFSHAGLSDHIIFTNSATHAHELGKSFDMDDYEAIFFISGDGMLHETVQGWALRHERKQDFLDWLDKRFIGHVPAGTSNSLPCSLAMDMKGSTKIDPVEFVARMIENMENGTNLTVDLYTVGKASGYQSRIPDENPLAKHFVWDFIMTSWGIVAEIDLMQEGFLRCLPACCRQTTAAVCQIIAAPSNLGTIKFELADAPNIPIKASDLSRLERDGDFYCLEGDFASVCISSLNFVASDFSVNPGKTTTAAGYLGIGKAKLS